MVQQYERVLVAVDGSYEAELAVEKAINVAKRNHAELILAHVIDAHAYQSDAIFGNGDFDIQIEHSKAVLQLYADMAEKQGIHHVDMITEIGNPKSLLANLLPKQTRADLIMVGATGTSGFERLLVGSTSEYILRNAEIDLLVVRDRNKTL